MRIARSITILFLFFTHSPQLMKNNEKFGVMVSAQELAPRIPQTQIEFGNLERMNSKFGFMLICWLEITHNGHTVSDACPGAT
jgi:hypothetical protein